MGDMSSVRVIEQIDDSESGIAGRPLLRRIPPTGNPEGVVYRLRRVLGERGPGVGST
jgi:hypothetical protein